MLGFLGRSCFLFDMSFNWLQIYFFVSHLTEPVPVFDSWDHLLTYRNRRRRFGLRCNLIAAIYNFEVGLSAAKPSISPP